MTNSNFIWYQVCQHIYLFFVIQGLSIHGIGYTTNNPRGPNGEPVIPGKDEAATIPRVKQLIIISRYSPWCTIVKNEEGVTIGNVCSAIYKEYIPSPPYRLRALITLFSYTDHNITEAEFNSLNTRSQEHVRRMASTNLQNHQSQTSWSFYTPQQAPERLRRVDWLRDRVYFEGLVRDDHYAKTRLGFRAPDVFVMELVS